MAKDSFMGEIDPKDFTQIAWKKIPPHPGNPRYRMAAVGDKKTSQVIFVGGSSNPYNFNGIGYNGKPSEPEKSVLIFNLLSLNWQTIQSTSIPTMDHRGLLNVDGSYYTLGGMTRDQTIIGSVIRHEILQ